MKFLIQENIARHKMAERERKKLKLLNDVDVSWLIDETCSMKKVQIRGQH